MTVLPARDAVGTALLKIAVRIDAAEMIDPEADAYRAHAPVTCGVAIDVPL